MLSWNTSLRAIIRKYSKMRRRLKMNKFVQLAKKNYPEHWNIEMVRNLVEKGRISEEEYEEITGEAYEEEE